HRAEPEGAGGQGRHAGADSRRGRLPCGLRADARPGGGVHPAAGGALRHRGRRLPRPFRQRLEDDPGAPMSRWVRQFHRWISILFTLTVVANFVAIAMVGEPPPWVTYAPLPPLFVLLATGLYLFVLPYAARRRKDRAFD